MHIMNLNQDVVARSAIARKMYMQMFGDDDDDDVK